MAGANRNTKFQAYLEEELKKVRGISVPVRSGLLRRAVVRKLPCGKLHPNPDDEFCFADVGPSYAIISQYVQKIADVQKFAQKNYFDEPLVVQRVRPDGYMLLNGHHRWAAAILMALPSVPVRIVNLTQEEDIRRMLQNSRHDRRVTLDLDEVIFCSGADAPSERALPFPFSAVYRERLRLGIPALFRFLNARGYDIWVYTAGYYSQDYIRALFRLYHMHVHGIVTGTARKRPANTPAEEKLKHLAAGRYPVTVHIDHKAVLRVDSRTHAYREWPLDGSSGQWSAQIMEIMGDAQQQE